jgi:GAF domain-containing protein/HAMP domain-containing protein
MTLPSTAASKPARRFNGRLARTILAVLLPLTLLPVLLLGGGIYYRSYTFLHSQIISQLNTAGEGQTAQISARMQAKDKFLATLINDPNFNIPLNTALRTSHGSPAYIGVRDQLLFDFNSLRGTESEPSFKQFFIVNSDKVVVVASNPNWEGLYLSGSSLDEMIGQTSSKAIYNSSPIFQNQFMVFSSRPYIDPQGQTKATVFGVADGTATQRDLLVSAIIGPAARSYLITKDGNIFGLGETNKVLSILSQASEDQKSKLLALISTSSQGETREYLSAGRQPVVAYTKYLPGLQAGLFIELPRQAVYAPLADQAPFIILLVIGTLFFLGVFIWLGTSRLVKPLVQLSSITTRFAEGEWQQRADINRNDEIGLLAYSFNQMADEIVSMYRSLESKVEARTKQVRAASEVAQLAISAPTTRDLIRRMVSLIIERFGYYDVSVFMIDESGVFAVLTESGQSASALKRGSAYKLAVGANSSVGWVTGHNQARVISDTLEDPLHLVAGLLPEAHSEAVIPISVGDYVLGALEVQSSEPNAFGPEDVSVLQTLTNQIAISIQNIRLLETTQISLAETSLLYQASQQISHADNQEQIYDIVVKTLAKTSFISGIFSLEADGLGVISLYNPNEQSEAVHAERLPVNPQQIRVLLPLDRSSYLVDLQSSDSFPGELQDIFKKSHCEALAVLPLKINGRLEAILVIGSPERGKLTPISVQPYANLAELISTSLEKVYAQQSMQQRLNELQILNSVSETISTQTGLYPICQEIHNALQKALGIVDFQLAIFDTQNNSIQIPYQVENNQLVSVDPFPFADDLTSMVIRSRQPLLLNHLTDEKLRDLGASIAGKPIKSWLGAPLMVGGEVFGAISVKDLENQERFTEVDVRLLVTLAGQVVGSIRNALMLDQARQFAEREKFLHEVTSRIRNSASIQSILETTATELGRALGARRASIFVGEAKTSPGTGPAKE